MKQRLLSFPWDILLFDITFFLVTWFADAILRFASPHLALLIWMAGPLNAAAMFVMMSGYEHGDTEATGVQGWVMRRVDSVYGLILVLGVGSFLWIMAPILAFDDRAISVAAQVNLWVLLFGGLLGYGLAVDKDISFDSWGMGLLRAFVLSLYLGVSETILLTCSTSGNMGTGGILFLMALSYLPFRLLLLLKPPATLLGFLLGAGSIAYFIYFIVKGPVAW